MPSRHFFLLLWIALVLSVLAWTLISYGSAPDAQLENEVLLRHGLLMLALTLPSGWLLSALFGLVFSLLGFDLVGVGDAIAVSIACAIAGYLQWFVLLPWLWRKWRSRGDRLMNQ